MGGAIARGVVTDPLVTSSPPTSGKIVGPPGAVPIVPGQPAGVYTSTDLQNNPEGVSGGSPRSDIYWDQSGLFAYTIRQPVPRIYQYNISPAWSITPGDWSGFGSAPPPSVGTTGFGMQLSTDRSRLSLTNTGSSGFIRTFPLGVVGDITTAGALDSSFFFGSGVSRHRWRADGLRVWVQQSQILRARDCITPFNMVGSTSQFDFDMSVDVPGSVNGWDLSADGLFLYASQNSDKRLVSWQMTSAFDMSTITTFDGSGGPLLNAGSNFFVPEGFNYRNDNGDIMMGDSLQSGGAAQRMQVVSP